MQLSHDVYDVYGARNAAMHVTSNTTFTALIKHLMWDENVRIAVSPERPLRAKGRAKAS